MSWSEIKHALNSTLGTSNFKSLDKLLQSYISKGGNVKCIKSVQSGTIEISEGKKTFFTDVTINPVNLNKAFLLVVDGYEYKSNESDWYRKYSYISAGGKLSSNKVTIYRNYPLSASVTYTLNWVVVEFY